MLLCESLSWRQKLLLRIWCMDYLGSHQGLRGLPASLASSLTTVRTLLLQWWTEIPTQGCRNPFPLASPSARDMSPSLPTLRVCLWPGLRAYPYAVSSRKPLWYVSSPTGLRASTGSFLPFPWHPSYKPTPLSSPPSCSSQRAEPCDLCSPSASCTSGCTQVLCTWLLRQTGPQGQLAHFVVRYFSETPKLIAFL